MTMDFVPEYLAWFGLMAFQAWLGHAVYVIVRVSPDTVSE
jgi:hypothetical protein